MIAINNKLTETLLALLVTTLLLLTLCTVYSPRWETNDDVAMSMVAHGYGIAAAATENIIFSNVIWGHLVRSIPTTNGILGYSIATFSVLFLFGFTLLHFLKRVGLSWLLSCALLALIATRPILYPQFTINAGFMTVAAILCWHLYERKENNHILFAGCVFSFLGFLIRSHEFLLVILIGIPLLPWNSLRKNKIVKLAALILLFSIASASLLDYAAYQGEDWNDFTAFNTARAPFTDFGAGVLLKLHPEILNKYNFSVNDVSLIEGWFFADASIANPSILKNMLTELGSKASATYTLSNGWAGIKTLSNAVLLPVTIAAIALTIIQPSRKIFLAWGLALMAFFALGVIGRPGIVRVYVPIVALLLIAPLMTGGNLNSTILSGIRTTTILSVAILNTALVLAASEKSHAQTESKLAGLANFPDQPVVVWGASFPFEAAYPVLKQIDAAMNYQLNGLGVFTLAPFSREHLNISQGNGIIKQLTAPSGVALIASDHNLKLLAKYCSEHFEGALETLSYNSYGHVEVKTMRCVLKVTSNSASSEL